MTTIIREPIGLRVLIRARRPDDHELFMLWRADTQPEIDALLERDEVPERAALWAALLRWSEAQAIATELIAAGWTITLHGVRAIVLERAVALLQPPNASEGWLLEVGGIGLRAVRELPAQDEAALVRLLAFLES